MAEVVLRPFNTIHSCPKCLTVLSIGTARRNAVRGRVRYCLGKHSVMQAMVGESECMQLPEHLHIRCLGCGFGWLTEVAPNG